MKKGKIIVNHYSFNFLRVFLIAVLSTLWSETYSQNWDWVRSYGGPYYQDGNSIVVDSMHNSYITGRFGEKCELGSFSFTGVIGNNIFVAKLNNMGNVQWAKSAGGDDNDVGRDIGLDPQGNVIITGHFGTTVDFSGTSITSNGLSDVFIAKYDPLGNLVWVRYFGGPNGDGANSMAIDNSGNIYVSGSFSDSIVIGNSVLHSKGADDLFVTKYDNNGVFQWIKCIGNDLTSRAGGLAVDNSNSVFFSGTFYGTLYSDNDSIVNIDGSGIHYKNDLFLVKLDENGNTVWLRDGSSQMINNEVYCYDTDVDEFGNIYMTGSFNDTLYFGGNFVVDHSSFNGDAFLCKFDSAGNHQWVVHGGAGGSDFGLTISCDENGNIYQSGIYWGDGQFGNITVNGAQSAFASTFLVKYDSSGNALWGMDEIQGGNSSRFLKIFAKDSAVYQVGQQSGSISVGNNYFPAMGGYEIIVGKLNFGSPDAVVTAPSGISFFPNPVRNTINFNSKPGDTIQIIDNIGKIIVPQFSSSTNGVMEIDVSKLSVGVYSFVVNGKSQLFVKF